MVGGGVSKSFDKFGPLIDIETEIVPATLRNKAGIIGAALVATRAAGTATGSDRDGGSGPRPERVEGAAQVALHDRPLVVVERPVEPLAAR